MAYPRRSSAKISGAVSVTTASQVLVGDHPGRMELSLVNNSDSDVSVQLREASGLNSVDPVAVVGEGIILKSGGGSWTSTSYTGPLAFIHDGVGAKSVAVVDI